MQANNFVRGTFYEKLIMIDISDKEQLKKYCMIMLLQQESKKLIRRRNALNKQIQRMKIEISQLNGDCDEKRYF